MSKVLINTETLTSIADAIREKTGETETYKPAEMPQAILSIEGGEIDKDFSVRYIRRNLTSDEINRILELAVDDLPVKDISEYLFYCQDEFDNLIIPNGYKYIYRNAFSRCYKLRTMSLPEGLVSIAYVAFEQCTSLQEVELPASIQTIEQEAFNKCTSLTKVIFKGTPTELHRLAFARCDALTDIYVPWAEGEVVNAPWGATNATVHYNYTE